MMNLRDVEVFRPYDSEFPEAMLELAGASDACIENLRAAEIVRVAKRGDLVLGVYAMSRKDMQCFEVLGVMVDAPHRHQGLGRWLMGHAIGVAESKGARWVKLLNSGTSRCFTRMGFYPADDTDGAPGTGERSRALRFDLIQE